jgi:hypothetical protein
LHVGGDFRSANAKQQLAEISRLSPAINMFPEEGARLFSRRSSAWAVEQQIR